MSTTSALPSAATRGADLGRKDFAEVYGVRALSTAARLRWAGLAVVLAAGLALRLLPLLCHGQHVGLFMDPDSWGYDAVARNLLAGHGYSWDATPPYAPNFYRLPGLPVLLYGLYRLTGPSVAAGIVLQALVGTASIWLVYLLVRRLRLPAGTALAAAAV